MFRGVNVTITERKRFRLVLLGHWLTKASHASASNKSKIACLEDVAIAPWELGEVVYDGMLLVRVLFRFSWKENDASLALKFAPISFVTGAWFSMFYVFLVHQSYTHFCAYKAILASCKKKAARRPCLYS